MRYGLRCIPLQSEDEQKNYPLRFQVEGQNSSSSGKISSRPASMSKTITSFDTGP